MSSQKNGESMGFILITTSFEPSKGVFARNFLRNNLANGLFSSETPSSTLKMMISAGLKRAFLTCLNLSPETIKAERLKGFSTGFLSLGFSGNCESSSNSLFPSSISSARLKSSSISTLRRCCPLSFYTVPSLNLPTLKGQGGGGETSELPKRAF